MTDATRRTFLKGFALAAGGLMLPKALKAMDPDELAYYTKAPELRPRSFSGVACHRDAFLLSDPNNPAERFWYRDDAIDEIVFADGSGRRIVDVRGVREVWQKEANGQIHRHLSIGDRVTGRDANSRVRITTNKHNIELLVGRGYEVTQTGPGFVLGGGEHGANINPRNPRILILGNPKGQR